MKNTKEFFGVLISILFCVFLVFLVVYATTTISDDITTGDDLTVTDDLIVNGLASVSETFRVPTIYGNTDAGLYLRIGDQALTSHSLDAQDDLLVTGDLEVDGTAFFDGTVSVSDANGILIGGGGYIKAGTASPSGNCVKGSIYINTGATDMTTMLNICDATNEWTVASISEP